MKPNDQIPPPAAESAPATDALKASRLRLAPSLAAELRSFAETGYPEEACGLLLGRLADSTTPSSSTTEVVAIRDAKNLNRQRARDRYELDPADLLAVELEGRERRLEVVGVWHSHPDHPARPSMTDLEAAWEGWSYLIVSVAAGRADELRSWRLAGGRFIEEAVTIEGGVGGETES